MPAEAMTHEIYLESGKKKVFAGALEWPGWCRFGRDRESAVAKLVEAAPRYARVLQGTGLRFSAPSSADDCVIVEQLEGDSTTDYGAPGKAPAVDANSVDDEALARLQTILSACWSEFETVIERAAGTDLRKGPRGGGRSRDKIRDHVIEAHDAYLKKLGWKAPHAGGTGLHERLQRLEQATVEGVAAAAAGELPTQGPRGGARWTARYFVRRSAWHLLDHAWEIEDRAVE
jgi:hypothetical protein